jgi:putative MATE family efflux protein
VGKLGPDAIAAVSTSSFIFWAVISLTQMLAVGVGALVARSIGAREKDKADRLGYQGFAWAVSAGIGVAAIGIPLLPALFRLMGTTASVTGEGVRYTTVLLVAGPVIFAYSVAEAVFKARGDATTPLRILLLAVLLNLVLDPLLIFGLGPFPRLGVTGAALATVGSWGLGVLLSVVLLLPSLRRGVRSGWFPHGGTLRRMLRVGTPISVAGFLFCFVYIFLARITSDFGTEALAALGIGHKLEGVSFSTCMGFAAAAATLVGQNLGAGRPERAASCTRRALYLLTLLQTLYGLAFLFLGRPITGIFSASTTVVLHSVAYLWAVAWSQPFMGMEILYEGAFGGAGNTLPPTVVSIPLTAARIPLAWILANPLGMGANGVWWAISITTVIKGLLIWAWWQRGRWKRYRP